MRVAPVGAYFADDLDRAIAEAKISASVTHAHGEGQAGAMAVAAATALAWQDREPLTLDPSRFIEKVADGTPPGSVCEGLRVASTLRPEAPVLVAAGTLGNGSRITASDTVPFAVWCVSRFRASFVDALWHTVGGLGDRDTTCAIVGGIVAVGVGGDGIPAEWRAAREPLP